MPDSAGSHRVVMLVGNTSCTSTRPITQPNGRDGIHDLPLIPHVILSASKLDLNGSLWHMAAMRLSQWRAAWISNGPRWCINQPRVSMRFSPDTRRLAQGCQSEMHFISIIPFCAPLVHKTAAQGFTIDEVSADKAYPSAANFEAVESHGGEFFPMFKSNATGAVGGAYEKAYHTFCLRRDDYLARYHLRSNVESTVSMVKRKFGDAVKAKNDVAQKNEVYAKFIAHNVCVLIAEMYALGIDPNFGNPPQAPLAIIQFPTQA